MNRFVALVVAVLPSLAGAAPPSATSATVARIQEFYDAAKDLHARFEQAIESQAGGEKHASGEVWLKKPGKMRWDYTKPEKKLMVSDGRTLWVYEPEDEQAFKQDLRSSTMPLSVAFLLGQGKIAEEFEVTLASAPGVGQPGEVVLKLVPKVATTAYKYLLFVADPKSGQVRQTLIYDQQGGVNRLTFSGLEPNRGLEDAKFRFKAPAGTRILSGER